MKRAMMLAAMLSAAPLAAAAPPAVIASSELSSHAARAMVDACLALAGTKGWKMHVAVLDRGGGLIAYGRSDGAVAGSRDVAMAKARTAALMGWPSELFGTIAYGKDGKTPGPMSTVPGMNGVPGGFPVKAGDALLAGIGVSGSMPTDDAACAKHGLEAAGF